MKRKVIHTGRDERGRPTVYEEYRDEGPHRALVKGEALVLLGRQRRATQDRTSVRNNTASGASGGRKFS